MTTVSRKELVFHVAKKRGNWYSNYDVVSRVVGEKGKGKYKIHKVPKIPTTNISSLGGKSFSVTDKNIFDNFY